MKLILIVDDEVDLTTTYSLLFKLHGFEVLTAANGREALDLIATTRPSVVLSDLMMPVMDGIALSRTLRSTADTASIPIVLMSGAPERHQLTAGDYDVFIRKPVRFPDLLQKIVTLMDTNSN